MRGIALYSGILLGCVCSHSFAQSWQGYPHAQTIRHHQTQPQPQPQRLPHPYYGYAQPPAPLYPPQRYAPSASSVPAAQPRPQPKPVSPAAAPPIMPPPKTYRWYGGLGAELAYIEDYVAQVSNARQAQTETYEFEGAFGLYAFVGYKPVSFFRVEAELGYRHFGIDNAEGIVEENGVVTRRFDPQEDLEDNETYVIRALTTMLNAYIDLPLQDHIYVAPYVGAGAGWMFQRNGAEADAFAWQLMAGLSYPINERSTIALGYRYLEAPDLLPGFDLENFNAETHAVTFSFRESF